MNALASLLSAVDSASILVVDSGSRTTATRDVARDAGVGYVRSDVPGLSIARNLGLAHATGQVVIYTDDDCSVDPRFLAPLMAPFGEPAVGAVTGRLRDRARDAPGALARADVLHRVPEGLDAGHGALMAFRRSVLLEIEGFDPMLGAGRRFGGAEDMDALCRVLAAGLQVVRVPSAVVDHLHTRDDGDYVRLNEAYGLGIGAMCSKWLRTSPRAGRRLGRVVVRRGVVRYVRRLHSARTRRGQAAYLRGLVRGWQEARRLPIDGWVFADLRPPAPVSATPADAPFTTGVGA